MKLIIKNKPTNNNLKPNHSLKQKIQKSNHKNNTSNNYKQNQIKIHLNPPKTTQHKNIKLNIN